MFLKGKKWHKNCSPTFCSYAEWVSLGKKGVYTWPKNKKDGHFHILDNPRYKDAYDGLLKIFNDISAIKIMSNSCKHLYQNLNESIHQRLWCICNKHKMHGMKRYIFAAQHIITVHNVRHLPASLHHLLGTMSPEMHKYLRSLSKEASRSARRKYFPLKHNAPHPRHRKKRRTQPNNPNYAAGAF